jgi:hypothetical protein
MADFSNPRESMEIGNHVYSVPRYPIHYRGVTIGVLPFICHLGAEVVYARKAYDCVGIIRGVAVLVRVVPLSRRLTDIKEGTLKYAGLD